MSSPQPVFYKNVVPLSKEQHLELFLEPLAGFDFANKTNSLYIAAVEFPQAAREYPIVFGKDPNDIVFPVALLGLKANQNLYVDEKGEWNASYIPAYARRYPFILARGNTAEQQQFTVCIDEGYSGFNTAKEGQPLFDSEGEQTELLTKAVDFLKDYQNHVELTTLFCNNLVELDLLEPMQANIEMRSGEKLSIGGFQSISREKLKAVEPGKLADLVKTDQMELIYAQLYSLRNVNTLMEKLG
jgi:SapC